MYRQHLLFLEQTTIESSSPQLRALRFISIRTDDACCFNIVALFWKYQKTSPNITINKLTNNDIPGMCRGACQEWECIEYVRKSDNTCAFNDLVYLYLYITYLLTMENSWSKYHFLSYFDTYVSCNYVRFLF